MGICKSDVHVLKSLYLELYPSIRHFVILNSGNEDDAKDVFQETLVVLYRKLKNPDFKLTSSLRTFLYSVGRYIWLNELDNRKRNIELYSVNEDFLIEETGVIETIEYNERLRLYREKFEELSDDCKRVLKMFLNNIPIREITKVMGYSSDQHTKNRRFRCKKSLINKIHECSKYKELGNGQF
jgi:RNA polymerase sigma factor (sigma-70 family)